jgi:site-specific recombinase XerD
MKARNRPLTDFEHAIVNRVACEISWKEAYEVSKLLPRLTAFLAGRQCGLADATEADLGAFCDTASETRTDRSLARMTSTLRVLFRILPLLAARPDNPSIGLKRPRWKRTVPDFDIDVKAIEHVITVHLDWVAVAEGKDRLIPARTLAILHLCSDAGASFPEIAELDLKDPDSDFMLAKGTVRERKARLSVQGENAVARWTELRLRHLSAGSKALFISLRAPWRRQNGETISNQIGQAIARAGPAAAGLRPAMFHKSLPAGILAAGLGWNLAARAAGRRMIPQIPRKPIDIQGLAALLERHHPMGTRGP